MILDLDPRTLHLPPSLRIGADPAKLQRQIVRFGRSTDGMPAIWAYRKSDGELAISDGVTLAPRVTKLLPAIFVRVEAIGDLTTPVAFDPTIGGTRAATVGLTTGPCTSRIGLRVGVR